MKSIFQSKTAGLALLPILDGAIEIMQAIKQSGLLPDAWRPYLELAFGVALIVVRLYTTEPATLRVPPGGGNGGIGISLFA
jgi:hypothetical protein